MSLMSLTAVELMQAHLSMAVQKHFDQKLVVRSLTHVSKKLSIEKIACALFLLH